LNYDPLQITVHARLLGRNVLSRSTGRFESEILLKLKVVLRPSGQFPADRKPELVKEA